MKLKVITGLVSALLIIGTLSLLMSIHPVIASGTIYIRADGSIDPSTANITSADNVTYIFTDNIYDSIVVQRNNITIDGAGYKLEGTEAPGSIGISLSLLTGVRNVTIKNALIKSFDFGIQLGWFSLNNTISGNSITHNNHGIYLGSFSAYNNITGNNIVGHGHEYGIYLSSSSSNSIGGNNIGPGNYYGIYLDASSNNAISGNTMTNNHDGIYLDQSSNNKFYHNNFNNFKNQPVMTPGYAHFWDNGYPSGGNYWSDHVCTGNPSDGSQPYVIDTNNIDHYPFQDPSGWLLPPVIKVLSPEYKTYSTSSVPLTFTINKLTSWIGYSLDNQANVTITGNTTLSGLSEGTHSITVYANDTVGNMGYSDTVYFTVDTTPPTISIVSPENKTYPVADVPLTFTVSESTSWIGYSLDGQANVTISGNDTITGLSEGSHNLIVYANDTSGNMASSQKVYFTVDTTPPNITDVSQNPSKNNVLPEDVVKVNATVIDGLSGVKQVTLNYTNGNGTWVTVDMTNLEGNIWNATIPPFPYCTNVTYIIIAEDNANNTITTEDLGYKYHVIPEFPTWTSILLIFIVLTFAIAIYKRRLLKTPIH